METSNDFANVKAVVLDIEGTTTSISFVKDTLFPYVRENITAHLDKFWEDEELKDDIKLLKEQAAKDKTDGVEGVVEIEDGDNLKESITKNVLWQMDGDKKTSALKQLQGHMWREAYKTGQIKGHIYPEVAETLKVWTEGGRRLFIYSSGSVEAQKLLFGHSEAGDLLSLLSGHFDTAVGLKTAQDSYTAIAKEIGLPAEELLFLTDVDKEAEAAKGAGFHTVLVVREGNAPLSEEILEKFQTVNSLADLVFQRCAKRAKTSVEEPETAAPATEEKKETAVVVEEKKDEVETPMETETEKKEETEPAKMETESTLEPAKEATLEDHKSEENKTENAETKEPTEGIEEPSKKPEEAKTEEVKEKETASTEENKEKEVTEEKKVEEISEDKKVEESSEEKKVEETNEEKKEEKTNGEKKEEEIKETKDEETNGEVKKTNGEEKKEEEVKTNGAEETKENGTTNGTAEKENGAKETNGKEISTETNGKSVETIEVKKLEEAAPPVVEVAVE